MSKSFVFGTPFCTGKQVENNKRLGEYYNTLDFEWNLKLSEKEVKNGDSKGRPPVIGYLHIGGQSFGYTMKSLKFLKYDIEEYITIVRKFRKKSQKVPIKHKDFELSHAELVKLLDIIEDTQYTFQRKLDFGFFK